MTASCCAVVQAERYSSLGNIVLQPQCCTLTSLQIGYVSLNPAPALSYHDSRHSDKRLPEITRDEHCIILQDDTFPMMASATMILPMLKGSANWQCSRTLVSWCRLVVSRKFCQMARLCKAGGHWWQVVVVRMFCQLAE